MGRAHPGKYSRGAQRELSLHTNCQSTMTAINSSKTAAKQQQLTGIITGFQFTKSLRVASSCN
jgi:hypothetical protein